MHPGVCLYKTEWGCPEGGESSVVFIGSLNPKFINIDNIRLKLAWQDAVFLLADCLKKELKQKTATLEFIPTEYLYME